MRFTAFISLILFSNFSLAAFTRYSIPLPKVNSDGSVIELWRPQHIPGTDPSNSNNWEPYKFYFKNVDGTYQKDRTINYPLDEIGANPVQTIFYYQDSALIEGLDEKFALINTMTGSLIKAFPKSPTPWGGAVAILMDESGNKVCMLAKHYAEVLDVERTSWISFTNTMSSPIYDNDGGDLRVIPLSSDGRWVTYMLAPKFQNHSMNYNYDIYRTNCFDSTQTYKIGSLPELKVEPGDAGSGGIYVGMRMSAIKVGEDTFVISRSAGVYTGAPAAFVKLQVTPQEVKVLKITEVPGFFKIGFLALDSSKNQVVAFGDWYRGHSKLSLNNAIVDLNSMVVREGAGVNKQLNPSSPVNKSRYTLRGSDLLTIGVDYSTLNPEWSNPNAYPIHRTEIYDFVTDRFEFLQ